MFTFCSLQGAQSESSASQSLLELDGGLKVLIDVGWDETFDVEKLRELEKQIPTLSLILLTHATVPHIAAYAHCCKHFPLFTRIPVYATHPVIALGRTLLQDLYSSTPLASTVIPTTSSFLLQPPTKEEINYYFSLVRPLKYSQPHQPLNGVTITAYNAGHSLGGTIWHIQHGLESIVYAVDWNQARENVLAGAAWLGGAGAGGAEVIEQLRKPTALICSSKGGERVALPGGRSKRDELLLDMIKSSISRGGIVLIPTDSGARMMELAYLLEHAWRTENKEEESTFKSAKAYLAVSTSEMTMRYTRSMFEWMDEAIIREFESQPGHEDQTGQQRRNPQELKSNAGPFEFKHLRLLGRKGQIDRILKETDSLGRSVGKVILASDTSLEWGFSKEVLRKIADDDKNLLILTEKLNQIEGASGLGRTLWSWWEERRDGVVTEPGSSGGVLEQVYGGGRDLEIREPKRIPLEGNDLTVYQQWLATQRQLQNTLQPGGTAALEASADIVDDASSDSSDSDDSETDQQGKALNISATIGQANRKKIGLSDEDLGVNILLRKKGVHDFDVRGKKGRDKMFPMAIRRKRNDDFGELIRPGEFLRAEERDELDGQEPQRPGKYDTKDTLGKKRKWDDVATSGKRRASNESKRQQIGQNEDDSVADILEEDDLMDIVEEIPGPSRLDVSTEILKINLRIAFVDFAGLHDKRSLQMLIPLIQPRKLILVGGMKDETLALASDCRKLLGSTKDKLVDVYTPEIGVIIDASVDTNAWAVKLTDSLVKQLRWQNVKGLGIVTLTGRLETTHIDTDSHDSEGANKKQKMLTGESEETATQSALDSAKSLFEMPTLDVLPSNMASATRSVAQPLHVGDLRLTDLRKIMQSSGLTAELRGEGTLLIDGSVIVRKTGTGRIEVESVGVITSSFYAVKGKIYEGLAVVAGG